MAEGVAEGAAEGVGGGIGHGHVDLHADLHADMDGDVHGDLGHGGLLSAIGFGKAPVTVIFSLIVFFSWTLCIVGTRLLGGILGPVLPGWLFATLLLVVALALAMFLSSLSSRPLARVFVVHQAPARSSLIGQVCVVNTGRVDPGFGQATVDDGGAGLLIQVRCEALSLKRGDEALIVSFDPEREAFVVEPYSEMSGR